ncbi:hypothetical protein QET40_07235 [Akkermansia sp. N21169]|jgi:hypothetical protein|uniref:VC0807 family protein n=1 Tax=unclassified Akkermansia TaxID=2608915 RepID=UPI00244E979F|nr:MULTISPECIES: VC0807 family protein [unclassified Akkermansia]MDH3068904.1 hypothetical protein [Akkermansia sp. N21169]WPX39287.1 VC0807 family protein [Akkermansia sp. N21116]
MPDSSQTASRSSSSWWGILMSVLIPVAVLEYCSEGAIDPWIRMPGQRVWEIGPLWAMVIALAFPIGYGLHSRFRDGKFDLMSAVGMTGVILTGVISLFVIAPDGSVHFCTPWLFGVKEALIPLFLGVVVVVSSRTNAPLLKTFIYKDDVFDVRLIEREIRSRGHETAYDSLLARVTWILAGAFMLSAFANFAVSYGFMSPVVLLPVSEQQVAYNVAIGKITWWGFLIIGVPLLAALGVIIVHLINSLERLTGLGKKQLMK